MASSPGGISRSGCNVAGVLFGGLGFLMEMFPSSCRPKRGNDCLLHPLPPMNKRKEETEMPLIYLL